MSVIKLDTLGSRSEFADKFGCGGRGADHKWHPVGIEFERTYAGPGRCTVVCLDCGACTYIETYWPGYKLTGALVDAREAGHEVVGFSGGETVYVVETGVYENRGVFGVYASLEAAMASRPAKAWEKLGPDDDHQWWENGLDEEAAATIREMELER
jgi:hypothetical protein